MAPQEMQKLISQENNSPSLSDLNDYSSEEAISQPNNEHVIVVQPDSSYSKANRKGGNGKGKGSKEKGSEEEPRNCVHLEAALFFFGIAGMVVSIVMLLQHLVIKYY
ncbi:hypothetical protein Ocin01_12667 [Orchesella cincta]|uniref:Uncharacterized protein n=1 Tax=Orchesella cincta TaxID=48709 RepID=A0A1D2MLV8_ORCCI|nr:hypothetical protein Ocin01_12667 [Orchesella cincta]